MSAITEGAVIFVAGIALGAVVGFLLAFDKFMRTETPTIKFEVTPEALKNINAAIVCSWLDGNNLTWMPKGIDFKLKVKS